MTSALLCRAAALPLVAFELGGNEQGQHLLAAWAAQAAEIRQLLVGLKPSSIPQQSDSGDMRRPQRNEGGDLRRSLSPRVDASDRRRRPDVMAMKSVKSVKAAGQRNYLKNIDQVGRVDVSSWPEGWGAERAVSLQ